jgi:hypothetical protein
MKHGNAETGRNGSRSDASAIHALSGDTDLWSMDFGQVFAEIRRRAFERLEPLDRIVEARLDEPAIAAIVKVR